MRAEGVGNTALAERLEVTEGAVRRLIDLDHRSYIGQVEAALHALEHLPVEDDYGSVARHVWEVGIVDGLGLFRSKRICWDGR